MVMSDAGSGVEHRVETVACPVCGDNVTVTAAYRQGEAGDIHLTDFECNHKGECGVPLWDPCPLYVLYSKRRFSK
jgi:hypothetical protein